MNLLVDKWIPTDNGKISLQDILCEEIDYSISCHRDDMELATLALIISLVQIVFPPKNIKELKQQINKPLTPKEYAKATKPYLEWFETNHLQYPFMQSRKLDRDGSSIQKLFNGLPCGNNHTWFRYEIKIDQACESCLAIMIFNQATSAPSFGGGFKYPLRGGSPISTFIKVGNLRNTIWRNILTKEFYQPYFSANANNFPTWVSPVENKQEVKSTEIGLLRGLFWQPIQMMIDWQKGDIICDSCQQPTSVYGQNFSKEKLEYKLDGFWPHPHSPTNTFVKKEDKSLVIVASSFSNSAPGWTYLANFLLEATKDDQQGYAPALVVKQYLENFVAEQESVSVIFGGYINNQASIIERRHEVFDLRETLPHIKEFNEYLELALEVKTLLRKKAFGLGKSLNDAGLADSCERRYYQYSEPLIHNLLHQFATNQPMSKSDFLAQLKKVCDQILKHTFGSKADQPEILKSKAGLFAGISKLADTLVAS